jgi:hypothetical protein
LSGNSIHFFPRSEKSDHQATLTQTTDTEDNLTTADLVAEIQEGKDMMIHETQHCDTQSSEEKTFALIQSASGKHREPHNLRRAYRLFWFAFILFFAGTGGGKLWDRVWHATRRFDTFWSPPHLFVFIITVCSGILVSVMAYVPSIRIWFGPTIRLPFTRLRAPGSLIILGSGLIALSFTITLDSFWHTAFGLDETQWSVPHDMLGWCWFTITFGFIAARLAFKAQRPVSWFTKGVIAVLMLEFMCPPMLGPFYLNYSPHLLQALKNLPIVRTEPDAQHMYRIYLNHGLTRQTSPLFIPMVSLFAGSALSLLRCIEKRARIFLVAPLLWSCFTTTRDLYTIMFLHYHGASNIQAIVPIALAEPSLWIPIPLFATTVVFELLRRTKRRETYCYALCGDFFGLCTCTIWHTSPWMFLLALPATLLIVVGSRIGTWLYSMLETPTLEKLATFLLISYTQVPAILGVVDLILRRTTP